MFWFMIACTLSVPVVGLAVGLRLLLLARKTRRLPETLLGFSLLFLTVLGLGLMMVSRRPEVFSTLLGDVTFPLGMGFLTLGVWLLLSFTRRVFRPDAMWARILVYLFGVEATF